jgi:hypothetical protein
MANAAARAHVSAMRLFLIDEPSPLVKDAEEAIAACSRFPEIQILK